MLIFQMLGTFCQAQIAYQRATYKNFYIGPMGGWALTGPL
jgi:hypothetical protein